MIAPMFGTVSNRDFEHSKDIGVVSCMTGFGGRPVITPFGS
jgi:hypothetical protein